MLKPSRRAAVIATCFALGLSCVGPYAHASLLGGGDSDSPAVEGLPLPLGGDLLDGGLLGEDGVLGLLGGDLLGEDGVLGLLGGDLLGGGLPVAGDVLGEGNPLSVLGDDVLAGEGVVETLGALPDLGAIVPGGGSLLEILTAFSESGSIVPGLQVLDEMGLLGLLGNI